MKVLKNHKKRKRRKKKKRIKMSKSQDAGVQTSNLKSGLRFPQTVFRDITDINRQVRLSCDSLAAYLQRSKLCQLKKPKVSAKETQMKVQKEPQTPLQIILPSEERTLEYFAKEKVGNFSVTYAKKSMRNMKYLQKTKSFISREDNLYGNTSSKTHWGADSVNSWSFNESNDIEVHGSHMDVYNQEKTDTQKIINIIQKELITVMEMLPSVAKTVNGLVEIFFHFRDCSRCNEKIKPDLPLIFNRIQKINKHLSVKRNKVHSLKKEEGESQPLLPKKQSSDGVNAVFLREPDVLLGKLQKVEATSVTGAVPGIQFQLEVKPPLPFKRFLLNAKNVKIANTARKLHPVIEFKEPQSNPLVQVLKPETENKIRLRNKQEIVSLKALNPPNKKIQFLYPCSRVDVFRLLTLKKKFLIPKENRTRSSVVEYILSEESADLSTSGQLSLNEKGFRGKQKIVPVPDIVREFLKEAQATMQVEKVKELEVEVKGLKDLMLEVHKNQLDLNKLMVEKRISSTNVVQVPSFKNFVDRPHSFGEENTSSKESLQSTVKNLKKKCDVKNKMIVTLLKGLQRDVPNEWWEQLVDFVFDESKPIDEFDNETARNFLQNSSVYLVQTDNETSQPRSSPRREDFTSEVLESPMGKKADIKNQDILAAFKSCKRILSDRKNDSFKSSEQTAEKELHLAHQTIPERRTDPGTKAGPGNRVYPANKTTKPISQSKALPSTKPLPVTKIFPLVKTVPKSLASKTASTFNQNMSSILAENNNIIRQNLNSYKEKLQKLATKNAEKKSLKLGSLLGINKKEVKRKSVEEENTDNENCTCSSTEADFEDFKSFDEKSSFDFRKKFIRSEIFPDKKDEESLLKSNRRRSENDLRVFEESVSSLLIPDSEEKEYLQRYINHRQVKDFIRTGGKCSMVLSPHPTTHYFLQSPVMFKPALWEPLNKKKVLKEELLTGSQPKFKNSVFEFKKQCSSTLKENKSLEPPVAKKQELETIPENDNSENLPRTSSSQDATHKIRTIKQLVKTFYKNLSILEMENKYFHKKDGSSDKRK